MMTEERLKKLNDYFEWLQDFAESCDECTDGEFLRKYPICENYIEHKQTDNELTE